MGAPRTEGAAMAGQVRSQEREEFLGDIISAAVEGGTGYWARVTQYQYVYDGETRVYVGGQVGDGARAILHEVDDDDDGTGYSREELLLDIEAVARGIGRIQRGEVKVNGSLRDLIALASRENDAGHIDAEAADVIAQAALLGEVRYG